MLISICIPEYNAERYIHKNLESILGQTYPDIEIVMVDDASSDGTAEIMSEYQRRYPDKISAFFSEKNQGIGATKNLALSHAKGEYVFFCDCDDILKPNCIEELAKEAEKSGFPDMVIDGFTRVDMQGNFLYDRVYQTKEEALQQSIPLFAKIMKRSFLLDNAIRSPEGVILEDVLYQARTVPNNPTVAVVQNCGYIWVKNLTSASNTRLHGFPEGRLEKGFHYLVDGYMQLKTEEQQRCMMYYIMQYVVWHLLKSGTGIGGKVTVSEFKKAQTFLNRNFPQYLNLNYISLFKPKGTRRSTRFAVFGVLLLMKLHLSKAFFFLYGTFDFSKLWPEL